MVHSEVNNFKTKQNLGVVHTWIVFNVIVHLSAILAFWFTIFL